MLLIEQDSVVYHEKARKRARAYLKTKSCKLAKLKRKQKGLDMYQTYKRNAKRNGRKFELSKSEFDAMTDRPCAYCGMSGRNGLDRVDNSSGYISNNVVSACQTCNFMKSTMNAKNFVIMCKCIASRHRCLTTTHITVSNRGKPSNCSWKEYRRSAERRDISFEIDESIHVLLVGNPCHYCGLVSCNGIDRKDNMEGYTQSNCLSCCKTCNKMKHKLDYDVFLDQCAKIARRHIDPDLHDNERFF